MTTIDLRGRDLVIMPPENLLTLSTPELLDTLFGDHLPGPVRASMGRDKRYHFLRTQPMHFTAIKRALSQQQTPFTVAFDERPALPFPVSLSIEPRPYQEDALTAWLAEESAGVVVLPTGAGKTLTVGVSAGFNEQLILAEMFKVLLENAGYTVNTQESLESRKVSDPALFSGQIDIKVEYLSSESIQNDPAAKTSGDPANNEQILKGIMSAKGVNVLDFSPAADENVFVVTKTTQTKYNLVNVSDLAKPAP